MTCSHRASYTHKSHPISEWLCGPRRRWRRRPWARETTVQAAATRNPKSSHRLLRRQAFPSLRVRLVSPLRGLPMARGLFRNGPHNRWRCRVRYADGTVRNASTGHRELGAARAAFRRLQREAADPAYAPIAPYTLGEALGAFLGALDANGGHSRRGCRPATIRYYQ